eukprot:6173683-Pleurochrysis_carterae.AAC.2
MRRCVASPVSRLSNDVATESTTQTAVKVRSSECVSPGLCRLRTTTAGIAIGEAGRVCGGAGRARRLPEYNSHDNCAERAVCRLPSSGGA